ncbi:cytochrome P450 [Lepidopterella palustris CBS 459.81]|uniref:Cytochrome P450 n=1 Tax=Lepidopterella palustris CBS 459.81 TaxID=1314670 RepID=A0A8E2E521_9PEZI|nr:cytochrome P450 [Lepidopterella palustris CBS 459.81]
MSTFDAKLLVGEKYKLQNITTTCTTILSLFLLYFVGNAIYNIYFHPLSKYPGPYLAAASRLPNAWYLIRGTNVRRACYLHDKYGPVVRVGPNELSYTNAQGWKDIYGHRVGGKSAIGKWRTFYRNPGDEVDSIFTGSDEVHTKARRMFSHAFSEKALKEQEPLFQKYVNLLVAKLNQAIQSEGGHDRAFNMVDMYNFTTFDVMGDLTFGEPLHLLDNSSYTPWVSDMFNGVKALTIIRVTRYFPLLESILNRCIPRSLEEKRLSHFKYTVDRVNRRLATKSTKPDIWTLVLRHQVDASRLSLEEMHANASIFMIGGTETTATLLSGLTFHLLKNPLVLTKLTREIRDAFTRDEDITIEALTRLEYLNACIEEGLRMYPPVPIGMPRCTPPEGATICGKFVPGGTVVYMSHYATYYSAANFTSPKSFIPERWTGDLRFANDNKFAFQPFSYGPRNCLGKNMAYHEMRLILSKILFNFDLQLCEESEGWTNQECWTLWEKHPLMVKLTAVGKAL